MPLTAAERATMIERYAHGPTLLKRALANLVDNAAEATQQSRLREVQISTALAPGREVFALVKTVALGRNSYGRYDPAPGEDDDAL